MAFDPSKSILRNDEGDPIPQIWDDEQQEFIPDEGKQIGSIVVGGSDYPESIRHFGSLTEDEIILDISKPVVIDYVGLWVNNPEIRLNLRHRDSEGARRDRYSPISVETAIGNPTIEQIKEGLSPDFKIVEYSESDNKYLLELKSEIKFPFGLYFSISPDNTESDKASVSLIYREMEVV